jgi:site-specific DNA-methyltransferase (cytosine-N4-specific)
MVADELARALVQKHVPANGRVLDPFCGSGRLLAAAEHATLRVGIDANPLAWLLTQAKLAQPSASIIKAILAEIDTTRRIRRGRPLQPAGERKVEWFTPEVLVDLGCIITWINRLALAEAELLLVASALSATVREVSYARQSGWKLHRLDAVARATFAASAWDRLARRLRYCLHELTTTRPVEGAFHIELANARSLSQPDSSARSHGPYDVVLTSPPYGDSRTTVQYGAASSLCLSVVARIKGLEHLALTGPMIDNACLGGHLRDVDFDVDLKRYWGGSAATRVGRSVRAFLADYDDICESIALNLRPGGKAILVVGRRFTGGSRLKLDEFTVERFEARGVSLVSREMRDLQYKRVPRRINRFARSCSDADRARGIVTTMNSEIILVLQKRTRLRGGQDPISVTS